MSEYEGFGLTPLEVMSCGVPVICSNTTSIPEIVGNGGILIDPYDSRQLAMCLKHLMDDECCYQKLKMIARDRAKLFDWDKTVSVFINAFSTAPRNLVLDQLAPGAPPLVSYITVSYNAEMSIEKTIKSILACKKILSCEYIVVDGNSTDGTSEILRCYAGEIDRLVVEDDKGIYDAMNKGISFANGDYICFVNADDWLIPEGVKKIKGLLLAKHLRADIVATAAMSIDGSRQYRWNPVGLDRFSVFRCPNLCHNALYARTSLFRKIGIFDTQLKIAADSDWVIRAYLAGVRFVSSNAITVAYVIGGASSDFKLHAEDMVAIAQKHYPRLSESLIKSLFYYFFAWQDRRHLFIEKPNDQFMKVMRKASQIYPELFVPLISLKQGAKQLAIKGYARIKKII
jgi:glycosyltransferase involved in cell wall biosynthesis